MSRQLSSRVEIPAPVDRIVALRTGDLWVQLRAERLNDGSRVAGRTTRPDGGVDVSISRELPSGVPGFLERFLPDDGRVLQHERWGPVDPDGSCRGSWSVEIPGAPATLGGTSALSPDGVGSVQLIEGVVKVSVPLIGGRAEQFLVDMTQRLLATENALLVEAVSR